MRRQQTYGLLIFFTLIIAILQPEFLLSFFYALGIKNNDREAKKEKEADIIDVDLCYFKNIPSNAIEHIVFSNSSSSDLYFINGVLQTYRIPLVKINSNCFRIPSKHALAIFQEIDRRFAANNITYFAEKHADMFSLAKGKLDGFIEIIIEHVVNRYSKPSIIFAEGSNNYGDLFKSLNATVVWLDNKDYSFGLCRAIILLPEILVIDQLSEERVTYLASLLESLLDGEVSNLWKSITPSNQYQIEIYDHLIKFTELDTQEKNKNFTQRIRNFIPFISQTLERKYSLFHLLKKFISALAAKCPLARTPEYHQMQLELVNVYKEELKLFNKRVHDPKGGSPQELIQFRKASEVFATEFRNLDWIEQFYQQIRSLLEQGHDIHNIMVLCGKDHIPGLKPILDQILLGLLDSYKKTQIALYS